VQVETSKLRPHSSEHDMKKRRISYSTAANSISTNGYSDDVEPVGAGAELTIGESFFKPLYIVGEWEEPGTKTKRLTLALVLPSGVNKSDFTLQVLEGGLTLELTVQWPAPLIDLNLLHQKWLREAKKDEDCPFTMFHPKVLSLEDALKKKRKRAADSVTSTARILLPFAVQTHIESKTNLAFKDSGTKLVYVDLKAMAETYAVVKDNDEFQEF